MLIAIDPGAGGTGIAWGDPGRPQNVRVKVVEPKGDTWDERALGVTRAVLHLISDLPPGVLVIERPFVAMKGKYGAAAKRGDVVKLALLAGGIGYGFHGHALRWVDVETWKGQLSKSATEYRTRKLAHPDLIERLEGLEDHAWDAAGIWLHCHGSDIGWSPR